MKVSIIIPFRGRWDLVHSRMFELYENVHQICDVVLVDDDTQEEDKYRKGVGWWQKSVDKHCVRYVRNKKRLGFGKSMNRGAKIAIKNEAEILIFLSNDVKIYYDFVSEALRKIEENKNIIIGGRILLHDTGWNRIGDRIFPYLEGWLLACHVDVWKDLGGFDTRYGLFDYEDIDLSTTAIEKGYKLDIFTGGTLNHLTAQTEPYSPEREKITKENRQKFIEKWKDKI